MRDKRRQRQEKVKGEWEGVKGGGERKEEED